MRSSLVVAALALGLLTGRSERSELERRPVPVPDADADRVEATLREEGFTSVTAAADKDTVTLTGFVPTDEERVRARAIANRLPDVSVVEDRMLVQMSSPR